MSSLNEQSVSTKSPAITFYSLFVVLCTFPSLNLHRRQDTELLVFQRGPGRLQPPGHGKIFLDRYFDGSLLKLRQAVHFVF